MSLEPVIDKRQLVEYSAHAAVAKAEWRIVCAHEKFAYRLSNLQPVGYDELKGLREWLLGMEGFGWSPIREREGNNVTGLARGYASIELGAGGQVGLIGAPLHTLHETSAEIDQHLLEACEIAENLGIGFLGIGFHPTARREDIQKMPGSRGRILRDVLAKQGPQGLDIAMRSGGTYVGLHYADEADMVRKFRVALALQPVATAIFASSPFVEGAPNGYFSNRMRVLAEAGADRHGALPFVFEEGFGFERHVDYALDMPMLYVERDGRVVDCSGQSFRDFLAGKCTALPGALPTLKDWADHLAGLFPDVRLRKTLEMRGADAGSSEMLLALPSFWTGILYDDTACDGAWQLVKEWTADERRQLCADVPRLGLQATIQGRGISEIALEAVTLAREGLRRRVHRLYEGADETRYLAPLLESIDSEQSRADQLLMQFHHFTDFTTASIFDICRLLPPPDLRDEEVP